MARHHDPAFCAALGKQWIDAWNSHDLERVLALYSDDSEMTSDKIPLLGFDPTGTVRGKERLRQYWSKGLELLPNLHFTLIDTMSVPTASWSSTATSAAPGFASTCG
jgi:ketosteroid isomerase-like protein